MADDDIEDISPSSNQSFFVRAEFPFVFAPTTDSTLDDIHLHVSSNQKENTEDEEIDHTEGNDDNEEKSNFRISQPKYSQLLKELDFSQVRMVDVTNLLSDEADQAAVYLTSDENENQKKFSGDEKYQSLSSNRSSVSSNEAVHQQSSSNFDNTNDTDRNKTNEDENLINAANDIQNDLNNLTAIIQESSNEKNDTQKKHHAEEDDDTSKQATQNYDLNDNEQEDFGQSSKSGRIPRYNTQYSNSTQDDNLSSIPRLNTSTNIRSEPQEQEHVITWDNLINETDAYNQPPTYLIFSMPIDESHVTPIKQQEQHSLSSSQEKAKPRTNSSTKQKTYHRLRQLSASSDTDSVAEQTLHKNKQEISTDEDLDDLNTHLKQVILDQEQQTTKDRPYTTASDILLRRLSSRASPNRKKTHQKQSTSHPTGHDQNNDTWLNTLEKLEREHKERLDKQQKQYEDYMQSLEEKMKQRFGEYLSSTNSLQESKSENLDESVHLHRNHGSAPPIDSNAGRYRSYSHTHQYRPLAKDLINHSYQNNSTTNIPKSVQRQPIETNLSRSQSREDISNLRTELSVKHAKHISDLKLYYDNEINELKNQINRSKMGHTTSTTRQSIETIERINNENIQLHDEMKELRHSLKITEEENHSLKRQLDELREQLNHKDLQVKNDYRTITELEQQLTEAHNTKERQDEKFRHADRQALLYREENEKIKADLNLTRERLQRLEERYREQENENKTQRQPVFTAENHNNRMVDDLKLSSTMALNMPTSREYGRFTLSSSRYSSSTISTPRDGNLDSGRYPSNDSDEIFRHGNSPRPLTRISDYINEKPTFPQPYVPPSRPLYSPRKSSPNHRRIDQMPVRDLVDNHIKQSEQLEEKFDSLLRKKRDLESRINRIPTRGLTTTDRQLLEVLEREIERVEQQISSVKLELRKMNILRTH